MKWYRITTYLDGIDELNVIRETEKTIVVTREHWGKIIESKEKKKSVYSACFKTKQEAIKQKVIWSNKKVENLKSQIRYNEERLERFLKENT